MTIDARAANESRGKGLTRKRGRPTFNVQPDRRPAKHHVIYFVGAANGLVKIGTTGNLNERMKMLRFQSPVAVELLATTSGQRTQEFEYHRRFAAHRQHGEWFTRCPEIEAEIARLNGLPS